MTVFVTKEFARFRRKAMLSVEKLLDAASEVADGRFDAGGFRTIIVFRTGGHSFFVHGFAKSDKANVSTKELKALRQLADLLLAFSNEDLRTARAAGELIEVVRDGEEKEG